MEIHESSLEITQFITRVHVTRNQIVIYESYYKELATMAAIYLKFKRTIASTRRCTFPHCVTPLNQIRNVKRSERFKAFQTKKMYIPSRARLHMCQSFE